MTSPKTTCFLSRWDVAATVMKNWDPFVPGPALACQKFSPYWFGENNIRKMDTIDRRKGFVWFTAKASSSNFSPYIDSPPVPVRQRLRCVRSGIEKQRGAVPFPAVKSPPWHINLPYICTYSFRSLEVRWGLTPWLLDGNPILCSKEPSLRPHWRPFRQYTKHLFILIKRPPSPK